MPQEITDQTMVIALFQGRPEALGWIYDKYAPVLTGLATRIMGDKEKAEAVLLESFVAIWGRKETYDATRLSLLSWLIIIIRGNAKNALKSGTYVDFNNNDELLNGVGEACNVCDCSSTHNTEKSIKELFGDLEVDEKAALDLVYLKGYICADAAAELGIPLETLKTRLQMAGKHLREGRAK